MIVEHKRFSKSLQDVGSWVERGLPPRLERVHNYINGTEPSPPCNELTKLAMAGIRHSLNLARSQPHTTTAKTLAVSITQKLVAESLTIARLKSTKKIHYQDLDGIVLIMFCALATGQLKLIPSFHRTVMDGLENGYGITDGHNLPIGTTLRYAAFGLTIIGDWLGKPLDLNKHALPRDPAWGQLVAHWREPDPEKLLPIVLAACDVHVERIALTSREVDSGKFEFGSTFEAVYPAEILAIINLRRSLGLPTPVIDHPLMQTPYAALTLPPNTRLEPDELLENFLKAACRLNPEAVPEGLYEAVMNTRTEC